MFRNLYTMDNLMKIVEEGGGSAAAEGFKVLATGTMNLLARDKEVHGLFK
jgi:hypothetical protein